MKRLITITALVATVTACSGRDPAVHDDGVPDQAGPVVNPNELAVVTEARSLFPRTLELHQKIVARSCAPNAGLAGQLTLVAMRDIRRGEQICYDYAMTDASQYDEFLCQCGAPECRGRITGRDWSLPHLWESYGGHFSPYILRRIASLRAAQRFRRTSRRKAG